MQPQSMHNSEWKVNRQLTATRETYPKAPIYRWKRKLKFSYLVDEAVCEELIRVSNQFGVAVVTIKRLATKLRKAESTIKVALSRLAAAGVLTSAKRHDRKGRRAANAYVLNVGAKCHFAPSKVDARRAAKKAAIFAEKLAKQRAREQRKLAKIEHEPKAEKRGDYITNRASEVGLPWCSRDYWDDTWMNGGLWQ